MGQVNQHGRSFDLGVSLSFCPVLLITRVKLGVSPLSTQLISQGDTLAPELTGVFTEQTVGKRRCNGRGRLVTWGPWSTLCSLEHLLFSDPQGRLSLCHHACYFNSCLSLLLVLLTANLGTVSKSLWLTIWTEYLWHHPAPLQRDTVSFLLTLLWDNVHLFQ